ncbi:TIGR04219 family outer membrane beta-barrel protein [Marinobacter sp. CHS3-4]|uniref:TIGR04219 family outer membrane beta-barrel protein n=1 Tax=Marinobacter sp. CHS3-4 TaxID=3045174 RepID=UPI0024B57153|nr:TIGR04219 family outer membrane beta-barrel protein [Marinobacter sp. CHS3-4]MDI9245632.1 TIGR04219 family outer membrane beta-barrel protein [Marinobacter sp. CHS3-4]
MRKVMIAAGSAMVMTSSMAMSDVLGVGATVSYWDSDLSGEAANNSDVVDLENDLNLSSDGNANLEAYFEHPVPILPNIRLNRTSIEQSGSGELSADFDVIQGVGSVDVKSDLDLTQFDVTLYYEILDNWANVDLGITGRTLDGELIVREQGGAARVSRTEFEGTIPMGYLAAQIDMPFTGVSVGAQGNIISYDGDSISDFNAYGQYEISLLRLRAGYRQMSIDYEDSDDTLDVKIGGPFASVGLTF